MDESTPLVGGVTGGQGVNVAGRIDRLEQHFHHGEAPPPPPTDNLALAGVVPNPRFVGRKDEIERLRQALDAGDVSLTQAIRGEGGIGKTELAKAFLFARRADYDAVWWLDASPGGFSQSVRRLAQALRIGLPSDAEDEAVCALVRQAWDDGRRHLVVLDNVETDREYILLRSKLPCRTLVTARVAVCPGEVAEFRLDVLSPEDALALLRGRRPDLAGPADEAALAALAEEVGRHAQALALLAAYLLRYRDSTDPVRLLALLRVQPVGAARHPFARVPKTHAHPDYAHESVEASLSLFWDRLGPAAQDLLDLCAYVHPDNLPVPHLAEAAGLDADDADAALAELADLSVVRRTPGLVSLHRLTQAVVRSRIPEADARRRLAAWIEALNLVFSDPQDHRRFALMGTVEAHAAAVVERADAAGGLPGLGDLANGVGVFRFMTGRFAAALAAFREAERIDRKAYGDDHPSVARDVNNVGSVLHDRGDLQGALAAFREAERIDRAAYGDDHPSVAACVNNVGSVLRDRCDLDGALAAFREAERIDRKAYGDDHPSVARDVSNVGSVLHDRGDLDGALAAFREAERIDRAAYGDDHPRVAACVNNVGSVLRARGDLDGALAAFREAERIDRAAYGDEHPKVAIRVNNLGGVLRARGDRLGALAAYREALVVLVRAYGPRGMNVRAAAGNVAAVGGDPVAVVREALGDEAAAEVERALDEG